MLKTVELRRILQSWKLFSPNGDWVFTSPHGKNKPYSAGYIRNKTNILLKNWYGFTLKELRSIATELSEVSGLSIEDIQKQLGHSNIDTTQRYYQRMRKDWLKKFANMQDNFLVKSSIVPIDIDWFTYEEIEN